MNCSFTEKISSLIDGELNAVEAREVERHLVGCNDCQQLRADFLSLRTQIGSYETSLQPEVQNRALKKILGTDRRVPARGLGWSFGPAAVAFATVLIAAAIIGLLFYQNSKKNAQDSEQVARQQEQKPAPAPSGSVEQSRQQQPQATPEPGREQPQPSPNKGNEETPRRQPPKKIVREPKPGEQFAAVPAPIRSADAQTLTAMHFEKSETLLLAFRNVRLNEPGTATEVGYERKRARQLVYQNMILRREADASGDVQISSLLENLEPILIDIANLPDRPDENAVRVIRQRVERKNIVPLLRVNSTALARALD